MSKLKLTVNEKKTRVCNLPEEKFDFLGYTFGRCYSMRRGRVYLGTVPSKKRVQRICRAISDETGRDKVWQDSKTIVDKLNRMMIGWANYFCLGPVSKAYQCGRFTRPPEAASVVMRQTQRAAAGIQTISGSVSALCVWLGPVTTPDREPSVGESVSLFREPDAGNPPVRFDEREQETEPSQTGLRWRGESHSQITTGRLQSLRLFSTLLAITH